MLDGMLDGMLDENYIWASNIPKIGGLLDVVASNRSPFFGMLDELDYRGVPAFHFLRYLTDSSNISV